MKLRDLMSVVESSFVYIYSNPCDNNSFESRLLCRVEFFESRSGKEIDYFPSKFICLSYEHYSVVAVTVGLYGICVYVEGPDRV